MINMTTIHVKDDIWKKLNQLKESGETMNDVIERLLDRNLLLGGKEVIDPDDPFFNLKIESDKMPIDISEKVDDSVYQQINYLWKKLILKLFCDG